MLAPKLVKCLKRKEHYRTNSVIVNQFNTVFNALKASPRLSLQQGLGNLNTVETEEVTCSSTSKPPASILWYLSPSQPVFHPLHQCFSLFSTSAPLVFCIWRDFSALPSCLQPREWGCFTFSEDPDGLKCSFPHFSFLTFSLSQLNTYLSASHGFLSALLTCRQAKSPGFLG